MITIMLEAWIRIFSSAPERDFTEGAALFRREDAVEHAFLVRNGSVRLERHLADGTRLILDRTRASGMVARASLFGATYHCDAVCDVPSRIAVLPRPTVLEALGTTGLSFEILSEASRDVQALRSRVEIMRLKTLRARLDAYLELIGEPPRGGWVGVADWIGVTPPALYRELSKRRAAGEEL